MMVDRSWLPQSSSDLLLGFLIVGLPVANVSMYDASTAAAEAITCAVRINNKKAEQRDVVYVSQFVPPHRLSVIRNYTHGAGIELRVLEHGWDGHINLESAASAAGCCHRASRRRHAAGASFCLLLPSPRAPPPYVHR